MATKKRERAKKVPTTRKDRADDRLLKAVGNWVKVRGGDVIVVGGFQIQEWPQDSEHMFHVAVKCLGRKPEGAN